MMLTSLNPRSYDRMQLGAGVLIGNFDPAAHRTLEALDSALFSSLRSDCLGATRGGAFRLIKTIRQVQPDGVRGRVAGCAVVESAQPVLTSTLLEMTPENLRAALGAADVQREGERACILPAGEIRTGDHLKTLTWIGQTRRGRMAIVLENALCLADAAVDFGSRDEGALPVTFHAALPDGYAQRPPCRLYRYEPGGFERRTSD